MKKFILMLLLFIITGCNYSFEKINTEDLIFNPGDNHESSDIKYHDDNPVKISLYVEDEKEGIKKVGSEYHTTWQTKKDIVVLSSFYCDDEKLTGVYFQEIWKTCASKYENYLKYKTGWHITFTLKDGTLVDKYIFNPSDVEEFYQFLEIYLYDSFNPPIGSWYSHLTPNDMKDETIVTTIKLTAGSNFEQIGGDISITVFTYDTEDDFDEYGKYRGNSMYIVKVYND